MRLAHSPANSTPAFGVMGGYMQPQGHFQMLVNLIDLGMTPQQALDMPRWALAGPHAGLGADGRGRPGAHGGGHGFRPAGRTGPARASRLQAVTGFDRGTFGGGQIILRDPQTGVLTGGSDPRKDGCAMGW